MASSEKEEFSSHKHGVFFRTGVVIYSCLLVFVLLLAITLGYMYRPVRVLDQAIVTCSGGERFNAESAGVYFYVGNEVVTAYDDEQLKVFCSSPAGRDNRPLRMSTGVYRYFPKSDMTQAEKGAIPKNYTLNFSYKIESSLERAIGVFVLTLIIGFLLLETIRRILLYIFTGKNIFS